MGVSARHLRPTALTDLLHHTGLTVNRSHPSALANPVRRRSGGRSRRDSTSAGDELVALPATEHTYRLTCAPKCITTLLLVKLAPFFVRATGTCRTTRGPAWPGVSSLVVSSSGRKHGLVTRALKTRISPACAACVWQALSEVGRAGDHRLGAFERTFPRPSNSILLSSMSILGTFQCFRC